MKRTLHFAVVVSFVGMGTSALAQSCKNWYSGKASYDQMLETLSPQPRVFMNHVGSSNRENVTTLIRAQEANSPIEVSYVPRLGGRYRGYVSNVRSEQGRIEFDFNGEPFIHGLDAILDVRLLVVIKKPEYILPYVGHNKLEIARALLEAQQGNRSVQIKFTNGLTGKKVGTVSNLRIEDGYPMIDFNGMPVGLFHIERVVVVRALK